MKELNVEREKRKDPSLIHRAANSETPLDVTLSPVTIFRKMHILHFTLGREQKVTNLPQAGVTHKRHWLSWQLPLVVEVSKICVSSKPMGGGAWPFLVWSGLSG